MKLPGLAYETPNTFTLKQRLILRTVPLAISGVLKPILWTCQVEIRGQAHHDRVVADGGRGVLALFHETLGLAAWVHRGKNIHTTASYSFDGELAARVIAQFGAEAVRGSSSRGGSNALNQLVKALELMPLAALTIDGPRGPRRTSKPGAAILAARTGAHILPNAFAVSRPRRMKSWDRLILPRPFTRIICAFGAPIPPPDNDSREAVEAVRVRLDRELNELQAEIDQAVGDPQVLNRDQDSPSTRRS